MIFDFPESTEDVIVYTSDDGKVEIPDAAKDKVLTYQKNGETKFFTEDTVVTEEHHGYCRRKAAWCGTDLRKQ